MRFFIPTLKWHETPRWLRVIWIVAFTNFAVFWAVSVCSGGDAVNGREVAGRYFLASHGRYTEVSKAFFSYSRIHAHSVWFTHPLALVSLFWFISRRKEPIQPPQTTRAFGPRV